jgi:hypothetical protein
MSELGKVAEDFRVPPRPERPPVYYTKQQSKLLSDRAGTACVPHMGELYRDLYSAATKYRPPAVTPKNKIVRSKILHALHGNLCNIFNRAMEECGVERLSYSRSTNPYHAHVSMDSANYGCALQEDSMQFYWGINHGVFTNERDAALRRVRCTALLQAITSENAQNHIREGLGLSTDFSMEGLLEVAASPKFEFLENYAVGISLCNAEYAHMIPVNAGLVRGTGYNQFALFHPPEAVRGHGLFRGARMVWRRLSRQTRLAYLESFLGTIKVEISEPLYPLLHFMFNWKHGLAQSLCENNDALLGVRTGFLLDVISKDDLGLLFKHYGHLQLDCGLQVPSKRVDFARREVFISHIVQHGWLMLRKAILDSFLFDFVRTVHEQHTEKVALLLASPSSFRSKSKGKNKGKAKVPSETEKPKEGCCGDFLRSFLSGDQLTKLNALVYSDERPVVIDLFAEWRVSLPLSQPQ